MSSPLQVLAKKANPYILDGFTIGYQAYMEPARQAVAKEHTVAYIQLLLALCGERHSKLFEYNLKVFYASPMVWQYTSNVFTGFSVGMDELVISARVFSGKLAEITSQLVVPELVFFFDVPDTTGFLEAADDYYTKFQAWADVDKARLTRKFKNLISELHLSLFECEEDQTALITSKIQVLVQQLSRFSNRNEIALLKTELIATTKARLINLYTRVNLGSDLDRVLRMIDRIRHWFVVIGRPGLLEEIDAMYL